jgi:4-amino-4-deoxy-L-arabinose transferase-like glycosyltransferase
MDARPHRSAAVSQAMTLDAAHGAARTRASSLALLGVLLLGGGLRLAYVDRPFDHRIAHPWRQSDYLAITRSFDREGMDIRYPRVDWRGDTPGFAEMELPVVPWVGAAIYRAVGPSVPAQRALAAGLSIAALLLFAALAARLLPTGAALFAVLAMAVNPVLLVLATAIQPEPLLDVLCLASVTLLWRWREQPSGGRLLLAAAAAAAAMLAKLPAAYLGLLFAAVVLRRLGGAALRTPAVWAAALVALLPPLLWYAWANLFWRSYGLSLGLSNESHLIGWDVLWPPTFLLFIAGWETVAVFSPAGWLLALAALRGPSARLELPLLWYAAVAAFYVAAGRTTGDQWAYYYHSLSAAPGALLMGAGLAAWGERRVLPPHWRRAWGWQPSAGRLFAGLTVAGLLLTAALLVAHRDGDHGGGRLLYLCSREFAGRLPPDARVVVRGGRKADEHGHPVAWNASMAFAWADRRGFNYPIEDFSAQTLDALAARGGRYWIATPDDLQSAASAAITARYRQLATCGDRDYRLFDLRPDLPPEGR